jgi:uncharacterized protein YjbJ (UPF0337 family)
MNKDQVSGRLKEASGKLQKKVGDVTNNESAQVEGTEKTIAGKIQKNLGDAKNKVAGAIDQ